MSRSIRADDSAFALCQDALLHVDRNFAEGCALDALLVRIRSTFQALCEIDRAYTASGCEFGYIHFKDSARDGRRGADASEAGRRMVFYLPTEGLDRKRRYVGTDPLKQFETRARLERYGLRNELRLRFADMHEQYDQIIASLTLLLDKAQQLQCQAGAYLPEARNVLVADKKQYESTVQQLRKT